MNKKELIEKYFEEIFRPSNGEDFSIELMKGVLKLREERPELYLDNSSFAIILDSIEKNSPVFFIKSEIQKNDIIFSFKKK